MELIEKVLKHDGVETTVYFRELTGEEQLKLSKGQKFSASNVEGDGRFEVDLGDQLERNYRLVQMTMVTQDRKRVYPGMTDLLKEPKKKLAKLVTLANEAAKEEEEEPGKS